MSGESKFKGSYFAGDYCHCEVGVAQSV